MRRAQKAWGVECCKERRGRLSSEDPEEPPGSGARPATADFSERKDRSRSARPLERGQEAPRPTAAGRPGETQRERVSGVSRSQGQLGRQSLFWGRGEGAGDPSRDGKARQNACAAPRGRTHRRRGPGDAAGVRGVCTCARACAVRRPPLPQLSLDRCCTAGLPYFLIDKYISNIHKFS